MRKGLTRAATCLLCGLLFGAAGCGTDPQDEIISSTLTRLGEVTQNLGEIKKSVREAITTSEAKKQDIGEKDEYLLRAYASAQELRKLGERLQRLKELGDILKEKTSPEYSKDLVARYRTRLQDNVRSLEKEERELIVALAQANARANEGGKKQLDNVRKEIQRSREAFEVLTKQR
jgi:hypothetical protein